MLGELLGNRYEIIEKIGEGGMALVYKAKDRLLNRYVAIKVLKNEFVNDEEFIKKFRRESQSAASLSHPNIVSIYDVGMEKIGDNDIYYIVMEYIRGKTLKEVIREKGKLMVDETLNYSIQIAEALQHAHKNHIVHRDIKPHNIMITEEGIVKVTDFGIARAASSSTVTNTSSIVGSVHYFSPEQARGGYTDEKSDIYSLGIVMYEMITGKVPFEGDSPISVALKHIQENVVPPKEIDSSIPTGLQNIILKCIKKNQSERYTSAGELLNDLKMLRYSKDNIILKDVDSVDEPTRIIPKIEDRDEKVMKTKKKRKKDNKDGGLKVVFLAILLAFIVVSSLALGFFKVKDYFISEEITVPNLEGVNKDKAKEELERLGLGFEIVKEVYSDEYDKDVIVSQRTDAGTKVKKGYTIGVIVSKGGKLVEVPNLINRDITEIDSILREAGLEEGVVEYKSSDTVPANKIISQDPDPFSEVKSGTKVNVVVSEGPEVKLVSVPKIIGLTEKEAKNALIAHELVPGEIKRVPNNEYEEGRVFWQEIEAGNQIETNTSIDFYVSAGPEKETKEPADEPKETSFNIKYTPLSDDEEIEEVEIRVDRIQDGVKETIYRDVRQVGKEATIPLSGKPGARFELYQDGVLKEEFNYQGR